MGNCPYCDAEQNIYIGGWSLSPEGWAQMKRAHKNHHNPKDTQATCSCTPSTNPQEHRPVVIDFACPIHGKPVTPSKWEEEFDKMIEKVTASTMLPYIKSFIRSLLAQQKEQILEGKEEA